MPAYCSAFRLAHLATAGALVAASLPAAAQSNGLGLSAGRTQARVGCAITAFGCDDRNQATHLYSRTMLGNFWGAEVGVLDMERVSSTGARAKAQGLNISVIGRAPLGASFNLFGKVGATYGATDTLTATGSALAMGAERGFGLSYGAGLSYDFTPRLSASVAWDSHDFRFAGGGRDPVRAASLGLQYRY